MSWPHYRPVVTVVDALEAGACMDGLRTFIASRSGSIAGQTQELLSERYAVLASFADGYGYGNGDGYGNGNGEC